jgi:hypothetical protein
MEKYTTAEKISSQTVLKPEEQTEKSKIVLSNDAYAVTEMLENLIRRLNK